MVLKLKKELDKIGVESFYPDLSTNSDYFIMARGSDSKPKLIVTPKSHDEVQKIVKKLNENKQSAVIIAGKTGLVSAQRAQGEVVIDVSKLDQFISIDFANGDSFKFSKRNKSINSINQAEIWRDELENFIKSKNFDENSLREYIENASFTSQSGVAIGTADHILRSVGLMFPVEADSVTIGGGATLGGAASNRMNGEEFRYGTSADQCLFAKAINGNGDTINSFAQVNRLINTQEDNVKLRCDILSFENSCIGSEGTFSIITEAKFKAQIIPKQRNTFLIKVNSAEEAQIIKRETLKNFAETARLEIFNDYAKDSVQALSSSSYKNMFLEDVTTPFYLYVDIKDINRTELEESAGFRYYNFLAEKFGFEEEKHFVFEGDIKDVSIEHIPKIRKCMTETSDKIAQSKGSKFDYRTTFDVGIPANNFANFIEKLKEIEKKYNVKAFLFGHFAKDAFHLHIHTSENLSSTQENNATLKKTISDSIFENVYGLNGTCFTEHGVGQHNSDYWVEKTSQDEVVRWIAEKLQNDPKNIINPRSNSFDRILKILRENSPDGENLHEKILHYAQKANLLSCIDAINELRSNGYIQKS